MKGIIFSEAVESHPNLSEPLKVVITFALFVPGCHQRREVILASVPSRIQEALEMVGFTDYFPVEDTESDSASTT
jgi:hypothetical protein